MLFAICSSFGRFLEVFHLRFGCIISFYRMDLVYWMIFRYFEHQCLTPTVFGNVAWKLPHNRMVHNWASCINYSNQPKKKGRKKCERSKRIESLGNGRCGTRWKTLNRWRVMGIISALVFFLLFCQALTVTWISYQISILQSEASIHMQFHHKNASNEYHHPVSLHSHCHLRWLEINLAWKILSKI